MKLIVGLGNPGTRYSKTRHNIGRLLVETIAKDQQQAFSNNKSVKASIASFEWEAQSVVLVCPETYMNRSGSAVKVLVDHYGLNAEKDLLIVVDDVALSFGRWRLRGQGSDGGHNGLKSIEDSLATTGYARLRCGIGSSNVPQQSEASLEKFVLQHFSSQENKALGSILAKGMAACRLWVTSPIESAMSAVNPNQE